MSSIAACQWLANPAVLLMLPPWTGFAVFGVVIDVGLFGQSVMWMSPDTRSAVTSARQLAPASTTDQSSASLPGVQLLPPPAWTVGAPVGATRCSAMAASGLGVCPPRLVS